MTEGRLDETHTVRLYHPQTSGPYQSGWRWEILGPLVANTAEGGIDIIGSFPLDGGSGASYDDAVAGIMAAWARLPHGGGEA